MFANFPAFQSSKTSLHWQSAFSSADVRRLRQFILLLVMVTTTLFLFCATCLGQSEFDDGEARSPRSAPDQFEIEAPETTGLETVITAESDARTSSNLSEEQLLEKLPKKVRREYEGRIVPALEGDDPQEFLLAIADFIARHDPTIIADVSEIVELQGFGSLQKKFTKSSIRAIEQGIPVRPDRMADALINFLVQGLLTHTESEIAELDLFEESLEHDANETFRESEQRFWEIHVWKNRLENIERVLGYAVELNRLGVAKAQKTADQEKLLQLQAPIHALGSSQMRFQMLRERETELRIVELERAEKTLQQPSDFDEALNAAFALEIHGAELAEFFREYPPEKLINDSLKDPALIEKCENLLASGRDAGGSTIEKAVLLRTGAHWWLRGRYGAAALAKGLLKPKLAMHDIALMVGLFMPKERPRAIGDYSAENDSFSPGYDRRHFYTWAVERKKITSSISNGSETAKSTEKVAGESASTFW